MGSKRGKRGRVVSPAAQEKLRQHETARLVNSLMYNGDLVGLRKVARARGLAADSLRARAWPFLLSGHGQKGCGLGAAGRATATLPDAEYLRLAGQEHRDSQVVLVDAERSLFKYTRSYPDEDRRALQHALRRMLNATINSFPKEHVFYYQGLHDIASVLLLVVGEAGAFRLLRDLVVGHLRDASRASLDAVVQLLPLLTWILRELDPPIAALIEQSGTPPFYCLSWFLTWFSHDLDSLRTCARLFDVFLASHPLLPLYVGAVAMHSHRQQLLQCSAMPELHTALVNLPITAVLGVDELCWRSLRLFHDTPPTALLHASGLRMVHATAPEAHLTATGICLPDKPVLEHGQVPQTMLQGVMGDYQRSITSGPPRGHRMVAVAAVALASVGVAVAASVISMYASQKALGPTLLQ